MEEMQVIVKLSSSLYSFLSEWGGLISCYSELPVLWWLTSVQSDDKKNNLSLHLRSCLCQLVNSAGLSGPLSLKLTLTEEPWMATHDDFPAPDVTFC